MAAKLHPWEANWTLGKRLGKGGQGLTHLVTRVNAPSEQAALKILKNNRLFRVLSGRRSQIEFPTVEVDGVDEVLLIAETARRGLDPLNP